MKINEIQVDYSIDPIKNKVTRSEKAAEICRMAYSSTGDNIQLRESFYIILLNRANNVIGFYRLSQGGITGCVADKRLAFGIALKALASGMILCHNHPSGNTEPSRADIALTRRFVEAGRILDVQVLDHIILTKDNYTSFVDKGLM